MLLNSESIHEDLGKLVLRLGAGGTMLLYHGWPKISGFADRMDTFSDPFGIGSAFSLALITFAEFFCAALLVLGLWTRVATIPLIIGMSVVVFMEKAGEPFPKKELPALYLIAFVVILLIGSGRYAVNRISFR
jgi:putative oxidoreductase